MRNAQGRNKDEKYAKLLKFNYLICIIQKKAVPLPAE